jgi:hypothetical protein
LVVKAADQVPVEVIQIGIEDNGNPRLFFVVPKDLTVANDGDNLAGVRIDDIAKALRLASRSRNKPAMRCAMAARLTHEKSASRRRF